MRQKLFQKEFGVLINNQNPLFPGGIYKFAIYSYEVKHEAKFECGFISLNDGPLNCKLSINIKVFLIHRTLISSFLNDYVFGNKKMATGHQE